MPYCADKKKCSKNNPTKFNAFMEDDLCYVADCFKLAEAQKPEAVTSNSTDGLYGKLTHIAASLLKARLPGSEEDYPKRFPKHVLRDIARHNECLRTLACQLIDLKRAL